MSFQQRIEAVLMAEKIKKRQTNRFPAANVTLEILRSNIQYIFNKEVANLMDNFIAKFFHPAIRNIKENTDESISENQVRFIIQFLQYIIETQILDS